MLATAGGRVSGARNGAPAHEVKFTALDLKSVDDDGTLRGLCQPVRPRGPRPRRGGARRLRRQPRASAARPASSCCSSTTRPADRRLGRSSREDARGLFVRGRLMPEVAKAREVLALMRAGALDGLSIGFRTVKGRARSRAPACAASRRSISGRSRSSPFRCCPRRASPRVKARPFAGGAPTEREFERWLTRDAGLTRTEARALLRDGLQGPPGPAGCGPGPIDERGARSRRASASRDACSSIAITATRQGPDMIDDTTPSRPRRGGDDVGAAFDDFMRAFEAFKETNDERLAEIERRGGGRSR